MTSRASNPPVTTLTRTRTEEAPLFEDQVREYRQNQRRRYNAQRSLQRITRRITGGAFNNSLEQQMDPQVQLRLSMQERASIVPAEVLYHSSRDDAHHRVYMHRSEEAMLVTSNQVDRAFIQPESFNQLQRSGMRFLHMGVIQVRIQILHRQEEGTLALIVFRDSRWQGDQAIFATMEVDLTYGSQLVYVIPDTMVPRLEATEADGIILTRSSKLSLTHEPEAPSKRSQLLASPRSHVSQTMSNQSTLNLTRINHQIYVAPVEKLQTLHSLPITRRTPGAL
ncbi:hypothetical protein ZIOFF_025128 [Zingiber officinale]|uniref:Polyprotein n=1 Tax=Zingiber officinale TaxID=94328 RepID=A0A8J5LJL4_ZINOF|nr:hypothetical protein ZIOFF_025128 [Zingiber officinale]